MEADYFCGKPVFDKTLDVLYYFVITGTIGVGKSTLYRLLKEYLGKKYGADVIFIPEYIDGKNKELAHQLLQMYLDKRLSDSSFQNYIQSYYTDEFVGEGAERMSKKIVIMERCMSDSIAIFSNLANRKKEPTHLDNLNLALMYQTCINTDHNVGAPNYFIKNFEFTKLKTVEQESSFQEIVKIIEDDLKLGIKNRVVGLYNDPEVCYKRLVERAREGESAYDMEFIKLNCRMYENLYKLFENPDVKRIYLTDLGLLYKE